MSIIYMKIGELYMQNCLYLTGVRAKGLQVWHVLIGRREVVVFCDLDITCVT